MKKTPHSVEFSMLAYAAGVLSAVFGGVHIAWAWGWRTGLPVDAALLAEQPLFLAYEVVTGILLLAAAIVFVVVGGVELTGRWHRGVTLLMLLGSQIALLRGVPALVFDVSALPTGMSVRSAGVLADVSFVVIGTCGLVIWRSMTGDRRTLAYR